MRCKVQIRVQFLKSLITKIMYYQRTTMYYHVLSKTQAALSYKLRYFDLYIFSLPREGTIIPGKFFLLHLHVKFLFSFEHVQPDSTAKLNFYAFQISNTFIVFQ